VSCSMPTLFLPTNILNEFLSNMVGGGVQLGSLNWERKEKHDPKQEADENILQRCLPKEEVKKNIVSSLKPQRKYRCYDLSLVKNKAQGWEQYPKRRWKVNSQSTGKQMDERKWRFRHKHLSQYRW
jgi:hypothetical protein